MKKRSGPKTKASKGQRLHVQMTITVPAELADKIANLTKAGHLTRSEVISFLLEKALPQPQKGNLTPDQK